MVASVEKLNYKKSCQTSTCLSSGPFKFDECVLTLDLALDVFFIILLTSIHQRNHYEHTIYTHVEQKHCHFYFCFWIHHICRDGANHARHASSN